ncbi:MULTISPECIES: glutathione S-transferase [Pseudomonas]|jgi:glutathione S-transferase|uniref:Glutathione S-transferase family protein n=2 Tax=Pseudomonas putida group TaxID=136845 RepID=Q88QZ9_PSEPK|nr:MULTISPECIES: glutathione S-transferase [Pseudomonas]AAN65966.1 Glutathione S-transferase family protein [Pseudomonas putida KT2440]KMU96055.1 glutathione S-transferase [Pseudomonas putida]KMY37861.1 glutathione S-transferase [Pseudomonas putida]MBP2841656.1 glutathione S-transferase [Pseudomonas sp. PNP]MCE0861260.1 glutathione S-transferase [Pseudomonas alloputida]
MSTMTLFHSPLSPFVRKVMVVLHETGQLERVQLQPVNISPVSGDPQLNLDNPIGKIPALRLEDGTVLHDSRVICEYLDQQHVGLPLLPREGSARWRRMTLVSQADAIMDAAVSSRYESFLRPEDKRWDGWLQAQGDKIRRSLDNLEQEHLPELISGFDLAAIGVACALGYLDLRQPGFGWRERQPGLAAWYAEVVKRPSMVATAPVA